MEEVLRASCEQFINAQTAILCGPIDDISKFLAGKPSQEDASTLLQSASSNLEQCIQTLREDLAVYLSNPVTQRILLRPVTASVRDAVGRLGRTARQLSCEDTILAAL